MKNQKESVNPNDVAQPDKLRIKTVHEIEHHGDLNNETDIMIKAGAKIEFTEPNFDAEFAEIGYKIDIPYNEYAKRYKEEYNKIYGEC